MLNFFKMEGALNDYVYIDALDMAGLPDFSTDEIRRISDRHAGIGADGLVIIAPGDAQADARMIMYNADGSASDMCGNALRCIGLYLFRRAGLREMRIASGAGVHTGRMLAELDAHTGYVEISVGASRFAPDEIPVRTDRLQLPADWNENTVLRNVQLDVEGNRYPVTLVSMGNPHCVLFVDDADRFALESIGPLVENHPAFPRRTNFEVVSRETYTTADGQQKERLYQRTFERGSGETLACGSGACAVHVAAVLNGISPARANIRLRGGELELEWNGSVRNPDTVFMRGPARFVFSGQLDRNVFR